MQTGSVERISWMKECNSLMGYLSCYGKIDGSWIDYVRT